MRKQKSRKNPLPLFISLVLIMTLLPLSEAVSPFGAQTGGVHAYASSKELSQDLKNALIDAKSKKKNAEPSKSGKAQALATTGPAPGRYLILPYKSATRPLTVKGASKNNGAKIYIFSCDMGKDQLYDVSYDANGQLRLKNVGSKKYVGIAASKAKNGVGVIQSSSSTSKKQRWIPEASGTKNGHPVFRLRSAVNENYSMRLSSTGDRDMSNILIRKTTKTNVEKFVFIKTNTTSAPASTAVLANGVYKIGSALSSTLSFAIPNSSLYDGAAPVLQKNSNSLSQFFTLTYSGGYYTIKPLVSGKSLSVNNGNILAYARLGQYDDAKKSYQRFKITQDSSGKYRINAKAGGLALRVASGSVAAGRPFETCYTSADISQAFTLTRVSSIPITNGLYSISPFANNKLNLSIDQGSLLSGASASVANDDRNFVQKFKITSFTKSGATYYTLENAGSGLVLSASGTSVVQTKLNANSKGIPADSQLWSSDLCQGGIRFVSKSTGKAIQLNGTVGSYSIKLETLSESSTQGFILNATTLFDSGQYRIECKAGGALEVTDGSFFKLANLQTGVASGSGAQAWYVKLNANGSITLKNERSGKPAEVAAATAGSAVRQNATSGLNAQKWIHTNSVGGWYTLRTAAGSTYLDANGAIVANGKKNVLVSAPPPAGSAIPDTQQWRFVPVTVTAPGPEMPKAAADAIETEARKHLGKPYVFGASGPKTFDCSGFIYYVLNNSGIREMARVTAQDIYYQCVKINPKDAKRGDIIFFTKTYDAGRPVTHVGFYLGGGMMIHAGDPVQVSSVNSKYFKDHFYAYGRIS